MPYMDGYACSLKIREFYDSQGLEQPVIVACTGNVEIEQMNMCWNSQMDEIVAKPATVESIS